MQTVYSILEYSLYALGNCAYLVNGRPCSSKRADGTRYCRRHKKQREQDASVIAGSRRQAAMFRKLWPGKSPTHVYFVQCDDGMQRPVKIGIALDIKTRIGEMQVGSPHPIRLLASFVGAREVEQQLHRVLAEHRIQGEWFRPCPEIDILVALARESRLKNIKHFIEA